MYVNFSLIVPVFNVERYLTKCFESIGNQTNQSYKMIAVDDGSSDCSGEMCDEESVNNDKCISVHKCNGGLSDARNIGIDYIHNALADTCDYICLIDSDDYIVPEMLEKIGLDIQKNKSDIVCFNLFETVDDGCSESEPKAKLDMRNEVIHEKKERFKLLLPPNTIGDFAVNKVYKTELFKGVRYPQGKLFEDVFTTYRLFDKAETISVLSDCFYVYRRRTGSITKSASFFKKMDDFLTATTEKTNYIKSVVPEETLFCDWEAVNVVLLYYSFTVNNALKLDASRMNRLRGILKKYDYIFRDKSYADSNVFNVKAGRRLIFSNCLGLLFLKMCNTRYKFYCWKSDCKIKINDRLNQLFNR